MKKGARGDIKAGMEAEETRHAATNKHKGRLRLRAMRLDGVLHAACCMLHTVCSVTCHTNINGSTTQITNHRQPR